MTKASDNPFPSILIRESADDGSDFSNPAADYRRLFLGEDGDLHLKDSSGTVTDFPAGGPGGSFDPDVHLPRTIQIVPFHAKANTNWSSLAGIDGSQLMNGGRESTGAQNAEVTWDVVLAAGTWTVHVIHIKGTDRGIISVQFDSVEKGTIDTYNGSLARNQLGSVAGITVAATALVELKLKMATKNASSSSYYGTINLISLIRTA